MVKYMDIHDREMRLNKYRVYIREDHIIKLFGVRYYGWTDIYAEITLTRDLQGQAPTGRIKSRSRPHWQSIIQGLESLIFLSTSGDIHTVHIFQVPLNQSVSVARRAAGAEWTLSGVVVAGLRLESAGNVPDGCAS